MLLGSFKFIKAIHFQCKKLKKKSWKSEVPPDTKQGTYKAILEKIFSNLLCLGGGVDLWKNLHNDFLSVHCDFPKSFLVYVRVG